MTLEQRVERLERVARRGWWTAGLLAVTLVAVVVMGQAGGNAPRVGRYQISASSGKVGDFHVIDTATGEIWASSDRGANWFTLGSVKEPQRARRMGP